MHEVVKATKKDDFILESSELVEEDFGAHYIVGTIKNNTNKTYNYVQVTFNLYDSQENQIGSAMANINSLKASGTWKYKAIALIDSSDEIAK